MQAAWGQVHDFSSRRVVGQTKLVGGKHKIKILKDFFWCSINWILWPVPVHIIRNWGLWRLESPPLSESHRRVCNRGLCRPVSTVLVVESVSARFSRSCWAAHPFYSKHRSRLKFFLISRINYFFFAGFHSQWVFSLSARAWRWILACVAAPRKSCAHNSPGTFLRARLNVIGNS